MRYVLIVAGLSTVAFDRLRTMSEKDLAPGGKIISRPNLALGSYQKNHADLLIEAARNYLISCDEHEPISIGLLYVDFKEATTRVLLDRFFPFCMRMTVEDLGEDYGSLNKNKSQARLNRFSQKILAASALLREKSRLMSDATNTANLNPLLLPLRNFGSDALRGMLAEILDRVQANHASGNVIKEQVAAFLARHPFTQADNSDRRRCLSDGSLYFKSPGKDRHGYLRNAKARDHKPDCVLNARSRLGGAYQHNFHFDCTPVKGKLASSYENCHCEATSPKESHVNISPNDFILS